MRMLCWVGRRHAGEGRRGYFLAKPSMGSEQGSAELDSFVGPSQAEVVTLYS